MSALHDKKSGGSASTRNTIQQSKPEGPANSSRRRFVGQAGAVSAGIALAGVFPHLKSAAQGPACKCNDQPFSPGTNCGLPLKNPGEITRDADGMLHSVLRVIGVPDRRVTYWDSGNGVAACGTYDLRAYEGYKGKKIDPAQRVNDPKVFGPGPTFRAQVGDTVQIALLDHINPRDFARTSNSECDVVRNAEGTEIYPAGKDTAPNCFRGSNTTNLHFHGTHVSPKCWGDNVLVQVVPDPRAKPEECEWAFDICKDQTCPDDWRLHDADKDRLQRYNEWQTLNNTRLEQHDKDFPERFDPAFYKKMADQNRQLDRYGEFSEYWVGCFPYCFTPPKWGLGGKYQMGQAPGTHWYHAHKHGSTSIQLFNGLAGALIIEGDYDKKLRTTMPGVQEKILVLQQFQTQPNRERGGAGAPADPLVNGQLRPVISMKPGEVQWWRIINATVQSVELLAFVNNQVFKPGSPLPPPAQRGVIPAFRQTAQDGVQLAWQNYQRMQNQTEIVVAPGNRVDLLVKAPTVLSPQSDSVLAWGADNPPGVTVPKMDILLHVKVELATSQIVYNHKWPERPNEYPDMPPFLDDIQNITETRLLQFQMEGRGKPPMINGRQFAEGRVDEAMLLGSAQEWKIENYSTISTHPFHIHVNPFQIVEIFDPNTMQSPQALPGPWIWWDTFALPAGKGSTGSVTPGYIKMRTRFADFTGKYVDHCHILAHEDRGMMQMVEVVDNTTVVKHH